MLVGILLPGSRQDRSCPGRRVRAHSFLLVEVMEMANEANPVFCDKPLCKGDLTSGKLAIRRSERTQSGGPSLTWTRA
jgi:hypothetical protein